MLDLKGPLNASTEEAENWVTTTAQRRQDWHADILNVDLLTYFQSDAHASAKDHTELVLMLKALRHTVHRQTNYHVEVGGCSI